MSSINFMSDFGTTLVSNGYRILPIKPGAKSPGRFMNGQWFEYPKWQRHCERDNFPQELDVWSRWPECGVGLACGNVIGIDIDIVSDPALALELETLARKMLGDTPAKRIGKAPKRALYYRAAEPFKGRKMHPLEIYGLGSQMVIYAIHPDTGEPYQWPDEGLVELDVSRLPEITEAQAMAWLAAAYARVPASLRPASHSRLDASPANEHTSSDRRGTVPAVKSALAYLPNDDVDGSSWIAMCNAIKAALGPAGRDLWVAWSQSSTKSGKSGKNNTAEKRYDTARPVKIGVGTIYHLAEQRGWVCPPHIHMNAAVAERAAQPHQAEEMLDDTETRLTKPAPAPAKPVLVDKFPADLLTVGGVIGDLVKLCVETAISPQPILALGAAIALVGTLAGRKYRTKANLRTNIYAIGIADSGGGKDYARTVIKDALYAAGLKEYLGGGKIASGSGLLTSLERHPCRLFLLDEMGKFVKSVTAPRVGAHREEIWTNLTELYTSAGSVYLGSEYADQKLRPRVDIVQPCLSVYGVTVPNAFWSALGTSDVSDGSLARFLLFLSDDDYPNRQDDVQVDATPDHIIAGLQAIAAGYGVSGDMPPMPDVAPVPYTVPETTEANALRHELTKDQLSWLRAKQGTDETAIVARFAENVGKVALIRAISDNPADPVINEENVQWATTLVRHCIRILLREAGRHVSDSAIGAIENRILEFVRKNGGEATAEQIGQAVRMKARDRREILDDLVARQRLTAAERATGGVRKTTLYGAITVH